MESHAFFVVMLMVAQRQIQHMLLRGIGRGPYCNLATCNIACNKFCRYSDTCHKAQGKHIARFQFTVQCRIGRIEGFFYGGRSCFQNVLMETCHKFPGSKSVLLLSIGWQGKLSEKSSFLKNRQIMQKLCEQNRKLAKCVESSSYQNGGNCRCPSLRDFYVKVALDI